MKKYITIAACTLAIFIIQSKTILKAPADKKELGKILFFDPILSANKKISCASCHKPDFAFADTVALSLGVDDKTGDRNTPSAMNMLFQKTLFWDGRAKTLEDQALAPIENKVEMNLPIDQAILRLRQSKKYRSYFKKIFESEPTKETLAQAIAAFERSLETSESAFDEWKYSDNQTAVSESVKRGFTLFNTKGKCVQCHFGADLTTHEFKNIGLFDGKRWNDSGRVTVTHKAEDIGKFKTPGLRNIALTAPYMHNGKLKTLAEVIEFYDDPNKLVPGAINRDSLLNKPLGLTLSEKKDIEAFLIALTDKQFLKH
jgi:cytochrome c peroxidase